METLLHAADVLFGLSSRPEQLGIVAAIMRALLIYIAMIVIVRFGKKRFLGEATAFDAIMVIIIGSIAGRAVVGAAPLGSALAAIVALVAFHWLISLIGRDWPMFSGLVKGHSRILIRNGRVDRQELRNAHMSDDDLAEDLRRSGVKRNSEVAEARLERDGKLSVLKR